MTQPLRPSRWLHFVFGAVLFPLIQPSRAAVVEFAQVSIPSGIISQTNYLDTPTHVSTLAAPITSGAYQFTEWTVNGVRMSDALGSSQNPASFNLLEPTLAVANYLPATQDTEGAGVPDWFKIFYFGNTNQAVSSVPAGDGYTLSQKYQYGLNPLVWTPFPSIEVVSGGIATARSALVTLNLNLSPTYQLVSSPPGFISMTNTVTNGTVVITPDLAGQNLSGYQFTFWDLAGVRQQDASGMALGSFSFVVTSNAVATANFLPATQDTEGAGVPDWFKVFYFGTTNQSADSIPAGDGYTLLQKYQYGLNPLAWAPFPTIEVVSGGLATARSALITLNLNLAPTYQLVSSPPGFIGLTNTVTNGTVVTTPDLAGQTFSGYQFTFWELAGVRQQDASGMALGSFSFVVTNDTVATANFLPAAQDTEGAGVPDWFKIFYFGTTNLAASSIPAGDGYTLLQKYQYGLNPLVWTPLPSVEIVPGGIATARSAGLTIMNLQPFERLQYTLVNGVLSNFFTGFEGAGGAKFGPDTAPALGDWDGDGDLDLFVASSPGTVQVFENIGSRFTMNLAERTANFATLSSAWSDIDSPALALGDWSGDGRADLVIGGSGSMVQLLSSTGNFNAPQSPGLSLTFATGSTNAIPALADMNGDGRVDLLLLLADGTVSVYTNTGNASVPFVAPPAIVNLLGQSVPQATGLAVADLNYDGRPDVLVSDASGRVWEFYQSNTPGVFTLMSKVWGGTGAGFANRLTIAVGDLKGNGVVDLVGGYAGGGLLALRDPSYGRPVNLQAAGGATSISLQWNPDGDSRIAGYIIRRSFPDTNGFGRLNSDPAVVPRYEDTQPTSGGTNFYRVTAMRGIIYAGNSVPHLVESRPSDIVGAGIGTVTLALSDYRGKPGGVAVLKVSTPLASGISATNLEIHIAYNPALLTPLSQIDAGSNTVEKTTLTKQLSLVDNGFNAQGELIITAAGGGVLTGSGTLLDLNFQVNPAAPLGAQDTNAFTLVSLSGASGNPLSVNSSAPAQFLAATHYIHGDLDGDGAVTPADFELALQLAVGLRPATPEEIIAGDLNGNGSIDMNDAQLILRLSQGQPENPQ